MNDKLEAPRFPILLDRPGTHKETAERIVRWHFHLSDGEKLSKMHGHGTLANAIEAVLNAGHERCAKIADKYAADMRSVTHRTEYGEGCLHAAEHIASEIRGNSNAE